MAYNPNENAESLESWVMTKVDEWNDYYRQEYKEKFEKYERKWRGVWDESDRGNGPKKERSQIISPALQQAVESSVAEIEEATFGRGSFFSIRDDIKVPEAPPQGASEQELQEFGMKQQKAEIEKNNILYLKSKLSSDFEKAKIRQNVGEVLINAAVYGTGIAEIVVDSLTEVTMAEGMVDGIQQQGIMTEDRAIIKIRPIKPQNFKIDPAAVTIEESIGVAIDEFVSPHSIELLQEQGVYLPGDLAIVAYGEDDLDKVPNAMKQPANKVRLTKYFGLVPRELLDKFNGLPDEDEMEVALEEAVEMMPEVESAEAEIGPKYIEACIYIANGATVLKAQENPYYLKDRPVVAFPWDVSPGEFWGRGVCEKGMNSQNALDTELRARIDALALTNAPMMAVDASKMPRGLRSQEEQGGGIPIAPGKTIMTNGNPREVLNPLSFGQVESNTFVQAEALQRMVQMATGAIDSAGIPGSINGEATAAGVSMGLGAIIKRHKRTLVNFQDSFLIPMIKMSACRYMQFDPEKFPVKDYKFQVTSTLGIIAREYEVTQLVQLLQTMGNETPLYPLLIQSIIENMNLSNREELITLIEQAQQPDPQAQQAAMAQAEAQMGMVMAQTQGFLAAAEESTTRAEKNRVETAAIAPKVENDRIKARAAAEKVDKELDQEVKGELALLDARINEQKVRGNLINSLKQ